MLFQFEALARCLNKTETVSLDFIEAAIGLTEAEIISKLDSHIYLNPQSREWDTVDQYLSENVIAKLVIAEQHPADL